MTVEAKTKEKPMYVQTYYYQCLEFEVDWDELEIDYDDVEQMYVKYATLHICLKDGSEIEVENFRELDIDWKHPDETYVYDENMNELGKI
tara:strand:+ start:426 stop:695 length:270 start_codon:yes stop_codon:yes gene_type:complete